MACPGNGFGRRTTQGTILRFLEQMLNFVCVAQPRMHANQFTQCSVSQNAGWACIGITPQRPRLLPSSQCTRKVAKSVVMQPQVGHQCQAIWGSNLRSGVVFEDGHVIHQTGSLLPLERTHQGSTLSHRGLADCNEEFVERALNT